MDRRPYSVLRGCFTKTPRAEPDSSAGPSPTVLGLQGLEQRVLAPVTNERQVSPEPRGDGHQMRARVGMSGYSYKEWKGTFYPDDLTSSDMLAYYATRFPTVEINNTFYRLPKESVLIGWADQVTDDFTFVLKASRRITHFNRLKDTESELSYLLGVSSTLGEKRGPTFFQLPPNLKKDLPRLQSFLALLPKRWPAAFEFRHASWFDEDVFAALRSSGAALCVADTDDGATPVVPTAEWGYVRLRRSAYDEGPLQEWADRIAAQPWSEAYVFFKHDDGVNPTHATRLAQLLST